MKKDAPQDKQSNPSQDQPDSRLHTVLIWLLDHPRIVDLLVLVIFLGLCALGEALA